MTKALCGICPHECMLEEGKAGLCKARINHGGKVRCGNYGMITSIALDPIEKKPLRRFHPGSRILSVGSYGCSFRCPFCQNYEISMADAKSAGCVYIPPEDLAEKAEKLKRQGNIGLAFTYNEPLISYEYVFDCFKITRQKGLLNVLVTNGFINEEPLKDLLPYVDAINIDLKSFSEGFYKKIGGSLETVKRSIVLCSRQCHAEVTTLIIPGENDSPGEMRALSEWLASVDAKIPLHISRFFPRYKMEMKSATPAEDIDILAGVARESLEYVYKGNC